MEKYHIEKVCIQLGSFVVLLDTYHSQDIAQYIKREVRSVRPRCYGSIG